MVYTRRLRCQVNRYTPSTPAKIRNHGVRHVYVAKGLGGFGGRTHDPAGKSMPSPLLSYESTAESLRQDFERSYRDRPAISRAPGRVNLIGEHTDYNDGFVMPVAIDFHTWIAVGSREDSVLHVESEQFSDVA